MYMSMVNGDMSLVADLSGQPNLDRDADLASHRVTHSPGNWVRLLMGDIVALSLGLGLTLGSGGVVGHSSTPYSISISISLSISISISLSISFPFVIVSTSISMTTVRTSFLVILSIIL